MRFERAEYVHDAMVGFILACAMIGPVLVVALHLIGVIE